MMALPAFLLAALAGLALMSAGGSTGAPKARPRTVDWEPRREGPQRQQARTPRVVRPTSIRETHQVPYQSPRYMPPQQAALAAPGLHPQLVVPSISEMTFPTGWSVQYLPTMESIVEQTIQMKHRLAPFMKPVIASERPVFAYRIISPSGTVTGSIVLAFAPDGSYRLVATQGPESRPLSEQSQTTAHLFTMLINGQPVKA